MAVLWLTLGAKIILFDRELALQGGSYIERLYSYFIMLFPTRLIGAAVLLSPSFVAALPRPDSAIGDEVAVSAPNGTPISAMRDIYSSMGSNVVTATEASYSPSYNSGKVVSEWASPTKTTQASSYSVPSYGSGSSSWGNQDYNSCVQRALQLEASRLSS